MECAIRHTPGVNAQAVAELTLAFMIMLARRLPTLTREMRDGIWTHGGGRQLVSDRRRRRLRSRRARRWRDCAVHSAPASSRTTSSTTPSSYALTTSHRLTLPALLAESDFVSIAPPARCFNARHRLPARNYAQMKPGAFLDQHGAGRHRRRTGASRCIDR